jgi:hypothetical protein
MAVLLFVIGAGAGAWVAATAVAGGLFWAYRLARRLAAQVSEADSISETGQTPAAVDAMPASDDFVLTPELNILELDRRRTSRFPAPFRASVTPGS